MLKKEQIVLTKWNHNVHVKLCNQNKGKKLKPFFENFKWEKM